MARFLFVVPPFFGHISPTLSVGASLLARGHAVVWVGIREIDQEHIPRGGKFLVPQEELAEHEDTIRKILKRQDDGPRIGGAEALKLALEETYLPFCRILMNGLNRLADDFEPDVIISDCTMFAGAICAFQKGIPLVTTTPVPPALLEDTIRTPRVFEWQKNLIMGLHQELGIPTEEFMVHPDKLNLVFTSQEFAGIRDPPPGMKFVGPVQGRPSPVEFDWGLLAGTTRPIVYVSIGTLLVDIRKTFFRQLTEAFAGEPLTIIAATEPDILETWPDNFIVQRYVPQTEIMARVDAVICHGGFNTVNDSFLHGLPMVILPMAYDQFHTASLVEKAGCGIALRYKRMRIPALREALWEVLRNDSYRKAALLTRETFIRAGGAEKAVFYLEEFKNKTNRKKFTPDRKEETFIP
ncbi:glycosyltransferase [Flavitalea flava]